MVLQLCPKPLGEAWRDEVVTLELKGNVEQLKSLFTLRDKVQDFLSSLSGLDRLTGMETIALSCEFYLMYARDPAEKSNTMAFAVGPPDMIPRQGQKNTTPYPVKLKLAAKPETKKRVIDNFTALLVFLREKYRGSDVKVNFYLMLVETFLYVLGKKDEIADYFGGSSAPESSELIKFKSQDCKQSEGEKSCSICGCVAMWKCTGVICCGKCRKFFYRCLSKDHESWPCQNQAGYCSILDKLQYIGERLYYPSPDGSLQPYISQSSALCPKCRYKRCVQLGMVPGIKKEYSPKIDNSSGKRTASPETSSSPECASLLKASSPDVAASPKCTTSPSPVMSSSSMTSKCVSCSGKEGIAPIHGKLLCQYCRMFLNDSIEENTYQTLACETDTKDCEVEGRGTEHYSTCPGCWIEKLKELGLLELAIAANNVQDISLLEDEKQKLSCENDKEKHEHASETCRVCLKETPNSFCGLSCCLNCKKFFLKSVKSGCYRDYCCSSAEGGWMGVGGLTGEDVNRKDKSGCSMETKSPCQQCRWKKCVSIGLKERYFSETKSGVKRTAQSQGPTAESSEGGSAAENEGELENIKNRKVEESSID